MKGFGRGWAGTQTNQPIRIENPLVIMFEGADGAVTCHLHPSKRCDSHETYGLLVADLVRHVARAFGVDEDEVWRWAEKERRHPTTDIVNPS